MKKYVSPVVLQSNDLAEGVYLASGDLAEGTYNDCWGKPEAESTQDYDNGRHIFKIRAHHSANHNSTKVVYSLQFSAPLTALSAEAGFACSYTGNMATVTRQLWANGNDNASFDVYASAADEATTKALTVQKIDYLCYEPEGSNNASTY